MATSEGIPSSIDIEFLELNDNPYLTILVYERTMQKALLYRKSVVYATLFRRKSVVL